MAKGTPSQGKKGNRKTHANCGRCGSRSFNKRKKICAACGFGRGPRMKHKPQAPTKKRKAKRK